jgi:CheY-like chemotaxis protein
VDIDVRAEGAFHVINVQDDGPGIPDEFLPHVFQRFRQADATTTRAHGGLGLGLAISAHLVEVHGGRVQARNRSDGHGAILTVSLPRLDGGREGALPASATPADLQGTWLDGRSVLIVDDEQDARELTQHVLERWGARVTAASSVADALRALEVELPDLVLTDIGMPGSDGFAFLRSLRARGRDRGGELPVAALTAYASAEDRHRILQAGFMVHVTKPVQLDELRRAVQTLLRGGAG